MSYQKKYYFSFKSLENISYTVEIWENSTEAITAAEIAGDANPCTIEYNNNYLFNPVVGSGANLSLQANGISLFDLYTKDMMMYQVRIYKDGTLFWLGFLDSENYSEDFSLLANYAIKITANDGFNLLERLDYVEADGRNYSGIRSYWLIINRIIQKLNLPWGYLYVGLSTSLPETYPTVEETVLDYLYANDANWYNEDNEAESCRTVLENLLQALGAFIIQLDGNLYITDLNYLMDASMHASYPGIAFKKYDYGYETTHYVGDEIVNICIGDISTLGVTSDRLPFEVESGINKQVVAYSRYQQSKLINFNAKNSFTELISTNTYGAAGYSWVERLYSLSTDWAKSNNGRFCTMAGAEEINENVSDEYLKIDSYGLTGYYYYNQEQDPEARHSFNYKLPIPYLINTTKYFIKISMSVYIRTVDDLNNTDNPPAIGVKAAFLSCKLQIGNKKYTRGFLGGSHNRWVDEAEPLGLNIMFRDNTDSYNNNPINDKWISLDNKNVVKYFQNEQFKETVESSDYLIPLDAAINGDITFDIYGYRVYDESTEQWTEITVKDFRIKDLKLSIVDSEGVETSKEDGGPGIYQ